MKPLGGQAILRSRVVTATECLRYAMSLPTSLVITGCDTMAILAVRFAGVARFLLDDVRDVTAADTKLLGIPKGVRPPE
jgi:hypothetical protein